MLTIRAAQLAALEEPPREAFIDAIYTHLSAIFPVDFERLGRDQMRVYLREAVRRGRAAGLTTRGGLCYYAGAGLMLGVGFDTDPQMRWAYDALMRRAGPEPACLQPLTDAVEAFLDRAGRTAYLRTLVRMRHVALDDLAATDLQWERTAFTLAERLMPERAAGIAACREELATAAARAAARAGVDDARGRVLCFILIALLGASFLSDPQHPWTTRALSSSTDDAVARSAALFHAAKAELERSLRLLFAASL